MHIRHLEQIFSIDKVVPVDSFPVFWQMLLLRQAHPSDCGIDFQQFLSKL